MPCTRTITVKFFNDSDTNENYYSHFLSLTLYNCIHYLNWLKAQIQCNYFKPKRPKIIWSLAQIWARAHGRPVTMKTGGGAN